MGNIFKKAFDAMEMERFFGNKGHCQLAGELSQSEKEFVEYMRDTMGRKFEGDTRYREPKRAPKATKEQIDETIENTDIYKEAKELILNAQREQVAYGIDKYPEPLNADSWTILETLKHKLSESVDRLHYDVMLVKQLERVMNSTGMAIDEDIRKDWEGGKLKDNFEQGYLAIPNEPGYMAIPEVELNDETPGIYFDKDNSGSDIHISIPESGISKEDLILALEAAVEQARRS